MMPKFLLLVVLMFFALGLAAIVMKRLMSISEKIADLQNDVKKSQVRLDAQMQVLEQKQAKSQMADDLEANHSESNDIREKNS